jgi:hypothetical protein
MKKTFKLAYRPGQQPQETLRTETPAGSTVNDLPGPMEKETTAVNRSDTVEGGHRGEARRLATGLARSARAMRTEDNSGQRKAGAITRKTIELVFYQFKRLMGAATQWFL